MASSVMAWGDFDQDGYLDCVVGGWDNSKSAFYRNLGNGHFLNMNDGPIGAEAGNAAGAAWVDYNNDGWPDLFVSNFQAGGMCCTATRGLAV